MTVVSVMSNINGYMSYCTHVGGDTWNITAPPNFPDGSYVCEFWATDDAGNIAYTTAILWIHDGRLTCIEFIDDKYKSKFIDNYFTSRVKEVIYSSILREELYVAYALPDTYSCHYVKRGCPNHD